MLYVWFFFFLLLINHVYKENRCLKIVQKNYLYYVFIYIFNAISMLVSFQILSPGSYEIVVGL